MSNNGQPRDAAGPTDGMIVPIDFAPDESDQLTEIEGVVDGYVFRGDADSELPEIGSTSEAEQIVHQTLAICHETLNLDPDTAFVEDLDPTDELYSHKMRAILLLDHAADYMAENTLDKQITKYIEEGVDVADDFDTEDAEIFARAIAAFEEQYGGREVMAIVVDDPTLLPEGMTADVLDRYTEMVELAEELRPFDVVEEDPTANDGSGTLAEEMDTVASDADIDAGVMDYQYETDDDDYNTERFGLGGNVVPDESIEDIENE